MSELCFSDSSKSSHFASLMLSYLKLLITLVHSHPLYFCYLIFFSPYILKLFSFLSPLFITTSLLLLGFLTICPKSKGESVLSTRKELEEKLTMRINPLDDDFLQFEELEMYKIVFDAPSFHQAENSDEDNKNSIFEGFDLIDEKTVEVDWEESVKPLVCMDMDTSVQKAPALQGLGGSDFFDSKPPVEERNLEEFLEPLEEFEDVASCVDEKRTMLLSNDPDKLDLGKEVLLKSTGSKELESKKSAFLDSPSSRAFDSSLSSYGSMRREKEWTRTLACKLFEERHRGDGEDGMDLLWETYENDSSNKCKKMKSNAKKTKSMKKIDSEFCYEEDGDVDEVMTPKLCCLQALKFSTGKMNLGMGKPNIVKISKAIKGFGWLHNVTRHNKKGYTSSRVISSRVIN